MSNPLEIIQKQIAEQTKAFLNTELANANLTVTSSKKGASTGSSIGNEISFLVPTWVKGSYVLPKSIYTVRISPKDFKDYSEKIEWTTHAQSTFSDVLLANENVLLGADVKAAEDNSILFDISVPDGVYVGIYTKETGQTNYKVVHEYLFGGISEPKIPINLTANVWTSIVIVLHNYSNDVDSGPMTLSLLPVESSVGSWRLFDIAPPAVPSGLAASFNVTNEETAVGRVKLTWDTDNSVDFGGNSIYRSAIIDSGINSQGRFPGTILRELVPISLPVGEAERWAYVFSSSATLSAGQKISVGTSSNPTTQISSVFQLGANLVKRPTFNGNITNIWTFSSNAQATLSDHNNRIGNQYAEFSKAGASTRHTVTSTFINVNTASLYNFSLFTAHDMLANRKFDRDGIGVSASRWTIGGSVDAASVAVFGGIPLLLVARSGGAGSIFSDAQTTFLSAFATYDFFTTASFNALATYSVQFKLTSTDAVVYTTPTISGSPKFNTQLHSFKPTATGTCYVSIRIPATTAETDWSVARFRNFVMGQRASTSVLEESLTVKFFTSGKTPCTPAQTSASLQQLPVPDVTQEQQVRVGLYDGFGEGDTAFPSGCVFVKLTYTASMNTANRIAAYRKVHSFVGLNSEDERFNNHIALPAYVFATPAQLIRQVATIHTFSGVESIFIHQNEKVADRLRNANDGSTSIWYDNTVIDNTTYTYSLDAFDTSTNSNRSARSAGVEILTGDTVAPKAPTSYTLSGVAGGFYHAWTNPTAADLAYIQISSVSDFSVIDNQVAAKPADPAQQGAFSEIVGSGDIGVAATRIIRAVDSWGNVSPTISGNATPLPENSTDLGLTVAIFDNITRTTRFRGNEFGWFKNGAYASLLTESSSAIASYFWSVRNTITDWTDWITFGGTLPFANSERWEARFKAKDIYGKHSVPTDTIKLFVDRNNPNVTNTNDSPIYPARQTIGNVRYNKVSWNAGNISDTMSGVYKVHIRRIEVPAGTFMSSNPNFDNIAVNNGSDGTLPLGYTWDQTDGTKTNLILSSDAFYQKYIRIANSTSSGGTLAGNSIVVQANASMQFRARWALPTWTENLTLTYGFLDETGSVLKSVATVATSAFGTYRYVFATYTTGAVKRVKSYVRFETAGTNSDVYRVGELSLVKNLPAFATVAESPIDAGSIDDLNVIPWRHYLYNIAAEDFAGNITGIDETLYAIPREDYRDRFRNMLNNSSFEKIETLANGTLFPRHWEENTPSGFGAFNRLSSGTGVSRISPTSWNGNQSMLLSGFGISDKAYVGQNNIQILPYTGTPRTFVFSAYVRRHLTDVNPAPLAAWAFSGFNSDSALISTKSPLIPYGDLSTRHWTRIVATLIVTVASMTHLSIGALSIAGTFMIDGLQIEEKQDGVPPTDYEDTTSITSDYLQGNLIRGNMIEANTIYTNHLQATSITAEKLAANSVAASNIQTDTITTNELQLANTTVYIRDKGDLRMEVSTAATQWQPYVTVATLPNTEESEYGFTGACFYKATGNPTTIGVFRVGDTFNLTSFSVNTDSQFNGFQRDLAFSSTYPYASSGFYLVVFTKDGSTSTLYKSYQPMTTRVPNASVFTTPTATGIRFVDADASNEMQKASLKYYNSNFYLTVASFGASSTSDKMSMYKLTEGGTRTNTYTWNADWDMTYYAMDVSPGGTFMILSAGATPTLHLTGRDSTGVVIVPTMSIFTYSGLDSNVTNNRAHSDLSACSVAYTGSNSWMISYRLKDNNYTYYKHITNGTLSSGRQSDLVLIDNRIAPNEFGGREQLAPRLTKGHNDSALFYMPAAAKRDSLGQSYFGRAVYLTKHSATIILSDLLNRIA